MGEDDVERSLVYPFIVCASNGGPFDDDAYVAGVEFGSIATKLEAAPAECSEMSFTVRSANVGQLDLAAANSHWLMERALWDEDPEWSFVKFRRAWDAEDHE